MGLFGGDSRTDASTTTTTTNSNNTTIGNLGFTGAQGVQALGYVVDGARLSLGDLNQTYRTSLASLGQYNASVMNSTIQFGGDTVNDVLNFADRANARADNTLSNVFNLVRDVSQRAVNVSSGQATPLSNVPGASAASTPEAIGSGASFNTVMIIAAIVGIIAVFK